MLVRNPFQHHHNRKHRNFTRNHNVSCPLDTVDKRFPAAVKVIKFAFVTESLTFMALKARLPSADISFRRKTPVVVLLLHQSRSLNFCHRILGLLLIFSL